MKKNSMNVEYEIIWKDKAVLNGDAHYISMADVKHDNDNNNQKSNNHESLIIWTIIDLNVSKLGSYIIKIKIKRKVFFVKFDL